MSEHKKHELTNALSLAHWTAAHLPIRYFGDPVLTTACKPFAASEFGSSEMTELAKQLTNTLITYRKHAGVGRGLAANQIGSNRQMIVVLLGDEMVCMVNPTTSNLQGQGSYWESCLSSGTMLVGEVIRPWTANVEYFSLDGGKQTLKANELETRLILHEVDHLLGEICTDKYTHASLRLVRNGKAELLAYKLIQL